MGCPLLHPSVKIEKNASHALAFNYRRALKKMIGAKGGRRAHVYRHTMHLGGKNKERWFWQFCILPRVKRRGERAPNRPRVEGIGH